jgi:hypothetical protein
MYYEIAPLIVGKGPIANRPFFQGPIANRPFFQGPFQKCPFFQRSISFLCRKCTGFRTMDILFSRGPATRVPIAAGMEPNTGSIINIYNTLLIYLHYRNKATGTTR